MNPIRRFNVWFDSIREPKRFLVFLGLTLCWYAPLSIGDMYEIKELSIVGIVGLVAMVIVALDRTCLFNPPRKNPKVHQ